MDEDLEVDGEEPEVAEEPEVVVEDDVQGSKDLEGVLHRVLVLLPPSVPLAEDCPNFSAGLLILLRTMITKKTYELITN